MGKEEEVSIALANTMVDMGLSQSSEGQLLKGKNTLPSRSVLLSFAYPFYNFLFSVLFP